jgi:hypothetical protein
MATASSLRILCDVVDSNRVDTLDIQLLAGRLIALVLSFKGALPEAGMETLEGLLAVREYKVAFEILCDLLSEQGLEVPKDSFAQLVSISESLGIDPSYLKGIAIEA